MSGEDPDRRARIARTLDALGAPAEPQGPEGRPLPVPSPEAMLEAMLAEIDRTVLARELRLRHPDGSELRIEAGNRRLLGFAAPIPDRLAALVARLPQTGLSYAGAGELAAVRDIFLAFHAGAAAVSLRMEPLSRRVPPDEAGASVATLRQAFAAPAAAEPAPAGPATPGDGAHEVLRAIRLELEEEAEAILHLEPGAGDETAGPDETVEDLRAVLEGAGPALEAAGGDPACLLLSTGDGGTLLVAAQGPARLALLLPGSSVEAVAEAWRTLGG